MFILGEDKKRKLPNSVYSSSDSGRFSTQYFKLAIERYKGKKNKISTRRNYHTIWTAFNKFIIKLDEIPHKWEHKLQLYCAFLIESGVQSSTMKSYASAVKQTLMTDGYKWDNDEFIMSSFTHTCKLQNDILKTRLPIQRGLLSLLISQVEINYNSQFYLSTLYKAIVLNSIPWTHENWRGH